MISIIIPAYNEEYVIERCLSAILNDSRGEFEVIVVCNACSDNTAHIARKFSEDVIVVEVEKPSKSNAINVGDTYANYFPRFYVDADVILDSSTIRHIVDLMSIDLSIYAASPLPRFDLSNSSWFVSGYYSIWQRNTFFHSECSIGGSGVYVLSETGHSFFDEFPDIILDDAFINNIIPQKNKRRLMTVWTSVVAPKDMLSLCKIKARGKIGLEQFKYNHPELYDASLRQRDLSGFFRRVLTFPGSWYLVIVYSCVMFCIWLYTKIKMSSSSSKYIWEKDNSSR